jgi:hypothetical protein
MKLHFAKATFSFWAGRFLTRQLIHHELRGHQVRPYQEFRPREAALHCRLDGTDWPLILEIEIDRGRIGNALLHVP